VAATENLLREFIKTIVETEQHRCVTLLLWTIDEIEDEHSRI
jgi:hypothetical protein